MAADSVTVPKRSRAGRPPSQPDPRRRILQEAARQFARGGYENSSVADLAAAVGISKAAIFHYYPTKQDIYDAIILDALQGLHEAVRDEAARAAPGLPRLRAFMLAHARYFEAHYDKFVTMLVGYSGMRSPERTDAARLRDGYEGLLRELLAEGVAQGHFRAQDPAVTGRAVLSMLNWMARWYKPGQGAGAEQVAEDYFQLITQGVGAPPAP